jgi:hypothetical protein
MDEKLSPEAELAVTQFLLRSAQEQAQIFEACYESEKRAHARTQETLDAALEVVDVTRGRVEWLLGGDWPGKHS